MTIKNDITNMLTIKNKCSCYDVKKERYQIVYENYFKIFIENTGRKCPDSGYLWVI